MLRLPRGQGDDEHKIIMIPLSPRLECVAPGNRDLVPEHQELVPHCRGQWQLIRNEMPARLQQPRQQADQFLLGNMGRTIVTASDGVSSCNQNRTQSEHREPLGEMIRQRGESSCGHELCDVMTDAQSGISA